MVNKIEFKVFKNKKVRIIWDENNEKWYISIIDVVGILTKSVDPNAYWRKLKQRLIKEGNETVKNCHSLKMPARDGRMRLTNVADTEQLLILLKSINSKKAEPFKLWLTKLADKMQNSEQ